LRTSESSTGRQRSFQPEPSRGVDQSDRVQLAFERILRNRLLAERLKGEEQPSSSLHDAAVVFLLLSLCSKQQGTGDC